MEHRAKLVAITLMCTALGVQALTLGRVRGVALIGRALDVVVPVQLDAHDNAASLCLDADVFHADTRQDPSQVRVDVGAPGTSQWTEVRIQSAALVDEPVVILYLRSGCEQKSTRKYVMLADPVSELQAPPVPLVVPPVSSAGSNDLPMRTTDDSIAASATPVPAARSTQARVRRVSKPATPVRTKAALHRAPAPSKVAQASEKPTQGQENNRTADVPSGQPRLKLDPLSQLSDRVALLESSPVAGSSQDVLRDLKRIQALDADVKALLALAAKNEASLADMRGRLQKAEAERFSATVVYGLAALVLTSLLAVLWLLLRQRKVHREAEDWWRNEPAATRLPPLSEIEAPPPVVVSKPQTSPSVSKVPDPEPPKFQESATPTEVDVSLMELSESNFDQLMKSGSVDGAIRKRSSPTPPAPPTTPARIGVIAKRSLNSEAVMDVRQQAEFFVSLGKADQAVRILERYIKESESPNPLLYLDLMGLFHSLGLKIEFRQVREDFNLLFNGRAPEFPMFMSEGRSLDAYPEVLARIGAHWGTARAVEVIESSIFRDPWEAKQTPFDLAAFRDLLMLHEVALDVLLTPATPADLLQTDALSANGLDLDLDLSEPAQTPDADAGEGQVQTDAPLFAPLDAVPESLEGDTLAPAEPADLMHFDLPKPGGSA